MQMSPKVAMQATDLLSSQNQLTVPYTAVRIIPNVYGYIIHSGDEP